MSKFKIGDSVSFEEHGMHFGFVSAKPRGNGYVQVSRDGSGGTFTLKEQQVSKAFPLNEEVEYLSMNGTMNTGFIRCKWKGLGANDKLFYIIENEHHSEMVPWDAPNIASLKVRRSSLVEALSEADQLLDTTAHKTDYTSDAGKMVNTLEELGIGKLNKLLWTTGHHPCRYSSEFAYREDLVVFQRVGGDLLARHLQEKFPEMNRLELLEVLALGVKVPMQEVLGFSSQIPFEEQEALKRELARSLGNLLTIAHLVHVDLTQGFKNYLIKITQEEELKMTGFFTKEEKSA